MNTQHDQGPDTLRPGPSSDESTREPSLLERVILSEQRIIELREAFVVAVRERNHQHGETNKDVGALTDRVDTLLLRTKSLEEEVSRRGAELTDRTTYLAEAIHELTEEAHAIKVQVEKLTGATERSANALERLDRRVGEHATKVDDGFALFSRAVQALEKEIRAQAQEQAEKDGRLAAELSRHATEVEARKTHDSIQDITLVGVVERQVKVEGTLAKLFPTKTSRVVAIVGVVGTAAGSAWPVIKAILDAVGKFQ